MRNVFPSAVALICCLLLYVVIWKRIPGNWPSIQNVYNSAVRSVFIWDDGPEFFEDDEVTAGTSTMNVSSGKNFNSKIWTSQKKILSSQQSPSGKYSRMTNATVIPGFFKKDFTKMPKWDFENVFMQNSEGRNTVCSDSLQKSKNKQFQDAVIWNIQLWLHKGHLNVSEWNRLAHFNNPFGFMQYNYLDIKPSVDLIPKPKSMQLLPLPKGSGDGCIRCAVVGTGGILSGSRKGKEIDSHHYVFRVNGAITKGYEEDVGNKTSVYVHTSFSLLQSVLILKKKGFRSSPNDKISCIGTDHLITFNLNPKGIKYVVIPEGLRDFQWIQSLLQKEQVLDGGFKGFRPLTFYGEQFKEDRFYVLHPDFLRYIRNRFLPSLTLNGVNWHMYRPTNGAFSLFLALHTCDIVNVYGFITEDHHKYSNYYYDRDKKTRVIFFINHDYGLEIKTWKRLHDSGIINLYQRKENLNQTVT